jgi:hypothetical protein
MLAEAGVADVADVADDDAPGDPGDAVFVGTRPAASAIRGS